MSLSVVHAQGNVLTYRYDAARSGLNPNETVLTPANVNSNQFGLLFAYPVDGAVYAQPLYMQNVAIPGKGTHNVVFVATQNDSVYAFDADSSWGANAAPLWQITVLDSAHGAAAGATPVSSTSLYCADINPIYGITATPAIDASTGTMYLDAMSMENGSVVHRLHALDITTGAEKSPGPLVIQPTVAGTGDGSSNNKITFDAMTQGNRAALLLLNSTIYIAFASHCDNYPFHGWVLAYDTGTFAQTAAFLSTPNGGAGGIWMGGGGIAADSSSNLYFASGNGTYDGVTEFGDSVLKMGAIANGTLPVLDWFTPYDQGNLDSGDIDQGSGGVLLIPDQPSGSPQQHLLVTGGKDGTIYLLDRDNMGHYNGSGNGQVWQSLPNAIPGLWGTPAWWNNNIFLAGSGDVGFPGDYLRAFSFDPGTDMLSGVATSHSPSQFTFPAPSPVVSANGTSNAIVWVIETDRYATGGPAVLRAYDATNLANELYNSSQNSARDNPGPAVKFAVPVVANGRVYVGTSGQLSVFGQLPQLTGVSVSPASVLSGASSTGTVQLSSAATQATTVSLSSSDSSAASVPASVQMNAGITSATFPITTGAVLSSTAVTLTASYGGITQSAALTVNPAPSGTAPAITSAPGTTFTTGTAGNFTVTATGTQPIAFSETGALPSGVTFSSAGVLSGTPAAGTQGSYPVTITATNGISPDASQSFSLAVSPAASSVGATARQFSSSAQYASNNTGYLSGASAFTISFWAKLATTAQTSTYTIESDTAGSSQWAVVYGYTPNSYEFYIAGGTGSPRPGSGIAVTDTNWHHIVYRYDGASWCYFLDGSKHVISSSIAFSLPAATQLHIANSDNLNNSLSASVSEVVLVDSALPDAEVAQLYALANPTTMGLSSSLIGYWPMGLASPDTDDSGNNRPLTLYGLPATVAGPAGTTSSAAAITSATSTTFTVGTADSFTVTATGTQPITFSETGALPSGVTFSSAGVLSGTPPAGTQGSYPITITAANGISPNAIQSFTLTVAGTAPTITSTAGTTFAIGTAGSFTVTATGTQPITFSETGALPSGVTFSSAGVLSGTPAAGTQGSYPVTITANNGISPDATQSFTLTVSSHKGHH